MAVLVLVRHGRTAANVKGVLAGWSPGVALDEHGVQQARTLGERLASTPFAAVVTSPLQRTVETAKFLLAAGAEGLARPALLRDRRLGEVKYGEWQNRTLASLAKEPMWRTVQDYPSQVTFPGGESLRAMQMRAVEAVREHDAHVTKEAGPNAVWIAVSHGDVIKAILADALGAHLDHFQRIAADPASVSVIRYTPARPFVLRTNDSGVDLATVLRPPSAPKKAGRKRAAHGHPSEGAPQSPSETAGDAPIGGGAGPEPADDGRPRKVTARSAGAG